VRFVSITPTGDGNYVDPSRYLERLPDFVEDLPAGARAYASDPDHYDFVGKRCVKDLKLQRIHFEELDGELGITLALQHNCWKHDEDLTIRYTGVHRFTVDLPDQGPRTLWQHGVILDEVLPDGAGCSHEIACLSGSVIVVCRDLMATWTDADCQDKP
jgi:hypothetical protein